MTASPEERLGEYTLVEELGSGAFGATWLATSADGTQVAIKRLKLDLLIDDSALERFQRETAALQSMSHVAVPKFIDSGLDDAGVPYLVQSHVPGPTIDEAVGAGRRFDSVAALSLTEALLRALDYLHGLYPPVIHRDLKPANIILADHGPVIIDFGAVCSRALAADESTNTVVGTFGYMAPEMLKGRASPASDLYSLGATLLFAFSGREPESFPTSRLRIDFRKVVALPDNLANLIEALLEPAVEDRPQSATEALALLGLDPASDPPIGDDSGAPVRSSKRGLKRRSASWGVKADAPKKTRYLKLAKRSGIVFAILTAASLVAFGPLATVLAIRTIATTGLILLIVAVIIMVLIGAT